MRNYCSLLAPAGLAILSLSTGIAADSRGGLSAGPPYTIDVWESGDGLPQNSVISMVQSGDGYLWLGTVYGLARFDGIRFTVYDESTTPGLSSSPIVTLFEDSQQNLWIGMEPSGIVRVQEGQVVPLRIDSEATVSRLIAICEDSAGGVWLFTSEGRLSRYLNGKLDSWLFPEGRFGTHRTVVAEPDGRLRISADDAVFLLDPKDIRPSAELPLVRTQTLSKLDFLLTSRNGGHWRLADGRVQKWKEDSLELDLGPYLWGNVRIMAACEDLHGNLLVGTLGAGVFCYNSKGEAVSVSRDEGLSYDVILSLHVDREGNLWVGTDGGGLNRVKRPVFETLAGTERTVVQSVSQDQEGGLWIGVNRLGPEANSLALWKNGVIQWYGPGEGMVNSSVRAMFVDQDQRVWAGTWGAGLFQFQNGKFRRVALPGRVSPRIQAIHQDRAGSLWVGTDGGLARWDGIQWSVFTVENGLSGETVRAIADDREGNLWVGTFRSGLNRLHNGEITAYHKEDGLPSEDILSLYVDDEDVLWIGTRGSGLARFRNGKWTQFTKQTGLISNIISYLVEDHLGYLWIGSNAGLMRIAKKTLNDFADGLTSVTPCRAYTELDGLPQLECVGFQPGACRASDGNLWFPTISGLVSVDPRELSPNSQPPPVIIESVFVDDQSQSANGLRGPSLEAVTIPADKERLEIHYTSLNLGAPDRARFKYRLEGHETAWTEAGSTRIARYSRLPPGQYRFQVTASNEDGVWNDTGRDFVITVVPPFWRTWWFVTTVTVCFLGVTIGSVHYVSTQRLKRQVDRLRQQEAIERERSRIARDIHDQLGASLTQVALLGELVESDKDVPDEVEAHAQQISQTARDTTRALDEIVWTVNPSNDTLDGLITYVCKYAQEYLAVAGLRYRLEAPQHLPETSISPEVRHNVFLASKEAVTNIVRHARASEVHIRLRLQSPGFVLEIQDDGCGLPGMDEIADKSRNGLHNMRKRMEDIGGSFSFEPTENGGTLIWLTVPIEVEVSD